MSIAFNELEKRLLTPVAEGGTFLNPEVPEELHTYNGTLLTYFLATHGGDPFAYIEFLNLNRITVFDLEEGMLVRVPQIEAFQGFSRHSEA